MKPKVHLLFTVFLFLADSTLHGQVNGLEITYSPGPVQLSVNSLLLNGQTTAAMLAEKLGQPSKKSDPWEGEWSMSYDQWGVIFYLQEDAVKALGITLNPDGDERFSPNRLQGRLMVDEAVLSPDSKFEDFNSIPSWPLLCAGKMVCYTESPEAPIRSMVGFLQDGRVSQVMFVW